MIAAVEVRRLFLTDNWLLPTANSFCRYFTVLISWAVCCLKAKSHL